MRWYDGLGVILVGSGLWFSLSSVCLICCVIVLSVRWFGLLLNGLVIVCVIVLSVISV